MSETTLSTLPTSTPQVGMHDAARDTPHGHPMIRRITHWLTAIAIFVMIGSGMRIYNNVPIFDFEFDLWYTLGGEPDFSYAQHNESGTASAIAWHFAGMWLLASSYLIYVVHGVLTRHFSRDLLPLTPRGFLRDFIAAATFRLKHGADYNYVQKAFYWGVLFAIAMMLVSGLAIWKPVQLYPLTWLMGGFDNARIVHFFFMTAIGAFIVVHIALVALVPSTLIGMTIGRLPRGKKP